MIALSELKKIQGDLKELSEENYIKLKNQILEFGFIAPFFIWKLKGQSRILDGHQRLSALDYMAAEGIKLPKKFPCVEIEAKNLKQAKKMILAISSNYGTMTTLGLEGFMEGINMSLEEVADSFTFDAINFNLMADVEVLPPEQKKESDIDPTKMHLQHTCPKCNYEW